MLADKVRSAKGAAGGGGGSATYYVAEIYNGEVSVQPFSSVSGYGTRYAAAADLPFVQGGVAFTSSGNAVVTGAYGNRVARAWQWSSAGFGTRYADLTDGANNYSYAFALHPSNNAIITGRDTGPPYIHAFAFSTATGFGAKFSNPGTTPTGEISDVHFSPDGNAVAAVGVTNNLISVYPWSGSGFGARYTGPTPNPLDAQIGTGFRVKFSPQSDAIVMCNGANSGPWIAGWPWSHATGFGTKYANPTVAIPAGLTSLAFSPAGDVVVVGCQSSPSILAYAFSAVTGFGTKYANPATLPGGAPRAIAFSPLGTEIAFSREFTNTLYFYRWSGSGFGELVADANTAPTHGVTHLAFGTVPGITPPAPTDPSFANVSLLLHMDGSNGSTAFPDSSSNAITVTRSGDAQISTAQSKFGGASALFDGSVDRLQTTSNAVFAFGTGDFTVEAWFYRTATAPGIQAMQILGTRPLNDGYADAWSLSINFQNVITFFTNTGIATSGSTLSLLNTWQHIAAVRSGTTLTLYLDGVNVGAGFNTQNYTQQILGIGAILDGTHPSFGYIDDVRITKGVARYTANFTPPTLPFPNS